MESNSLPPPKTKSFNKSKAHEEKTAAKKRARLWEILKSPLTVGLVVTLVFVGISINFYNVRSQQESSRSSLPFINKKLFEMIEWFDLKNQDRRLNMRGVQTPPPQVALLTIDDRSIEEIGRWPWSREKIAFVIEEMMKYGAKSIGFDIVFHGNSYRSGITVCRIGYFTDLVI